MKKKKIAKVYRFLRRPRELLRFQAARRDPPIVFVKQCPFPSPREDLPADVSPRISLCLCTGLQSHWILGSLLMVLWNGSTKMIS